jgi:hypothetical protein
VFDEPLALHCPHCEADLEDDVQPFASDDLQPAPRRRQRRPSGLRVAIGVIGGGILGVAIGAYALLWLKGADADFFGLSKWLPDSALPPSVQGATDVD